MYLKNFKLIIALLLALFMGVSATMASDREEAQFFADFIYEVAHTAQGTNPGSVCIFGYDEIVVAMLNKNKTLINIDKSPEKYGSCRAIYFAKDREKVLRNYIQKFNNKRILTISVLDNFNENGGMVFVELGRRNFELTINSKEIRESGIKLGPTVLDLVINN